MASYFLTGVSMKYSIRVAFRVYYRDLKLIIPYAMLLFVTAFLIYKTGMDLSANNNSSRIIFLSASLRFGIIGFLYFSFSAYEFSSRLRREGGEEAISVEKGAKVKLVLAQVLTLFTLLIGWLLLILITQIFYYFYHNIAYPAYLTHILLSVFLYYFCPALIAILFGLSMKSQERPLAYVLIALLSVLSSAIPLQLFAGIQIGRVSVLYLIDVFQWNVPNASYYPDAVYGIPLERSRWLLVLFWVSLLAFIVLWLNRSRRQQFVRLLSLALLLLSCLNFGFFMFRQNDSILQKDERPGGLVMGERNYRNTTQAQVENTAEFRVLSYVLSFNFQNNLEALARIELDEDDLDRYEFTLHHGYEVELVLDEHGNELVFERDGDFLDIQTVQSTKYLSIHYEGQAGKYYANRQAVALPGYLAFYPMTGHRLLWDYDRNSYKTDNNFLETDFYIEVQSPRDILSNLPSQGSNIFTGRAGTVSLYAGFVLDQEHDGQRYFYSPLSGQSLNLNPTAVQSAWDSLSSIVGIESDFKLDDKIVIYQPMTIALDSITEQFVDLGDHVLVLNLNPTVDSIVSQHIMNHIPELEETSIIKSAFEFNLYTESTYEVEKPAYEDMEIILWYDGIDDSPDDLSNFQRYSEAVSVWFSELYMYQMHHLGKDTVMREVYQYLTAESRSVNQLDFLYEMGEEDDD